jgi:hypothetical protein
MTDTGKLYSYEIRREGGEDILYANYLGAPFVPSIADSGEVMSRTIDALIENPHVSRVVLSQQKNYNYDFKETAAMIEIAQLYTYFMNQEKILSQEKIISSNFSQFPKRYNELFLSLCFLNQIPSLPFLI